MENTCDIYSTRLLHVGGPGFASVLRSTFVLFTLCFPYKIFFKILVSTTSYSAIVILLPSLSLRVKVLKIYL